MKSFTHINAESLGHAVAVLGELGERCRVNAGGSDLLGCLKDRLWTEYPTHILNLKTIPGLDAIEEKDGLLSIGALATLTRVAESPLVRGRWTALAEAAGRTASPLLRNIGTLGGNICQENRCWYYRYPDKLGGRIVCARKGGGTCYAVAGDHRFHSIFGAVNRCVAVNPSDTAPALAALNATIRTTRRDIPVGDFFAADRGAGSTVLDRDELGVAVRVPVPAPGTRSAFGKIALRRSIDFAIVNGAVAVTLEDGVVTAARICLNAVHNVPHRAQEAEERLIGGPLDEVRAVEAGEAAVRGAKPLLQNRYKINLARTLVADVLRRCMG